ncbi:MAG: hypothetical protein ACFFCV_07115 [Promethearchaeota archaeon]
MKLKEKTKRNEGKTKKEVNKEMEEDLENTQVFSNDDGLQDTFFETTEEAEAFRSLKETCEKLYKEQEERKKKEKNLTNQESRQIDNTSRKLPGRQEKKKKISRRF